MSEPKLISPMLDHFVMGGPISDHDGVRCCPAMPEDSDKRYIVKIISVPASPVQLEALLLTGACQSEADALSYFKSLSEGITEEADILQKLSTMEGFLPYESYQIVPMDNQVGFDVYLLGPYRKSLERHFRKYPMTHLAAVNLGLDMCAALAVCRQAGYLYADLKPGNIFISNEQEYRIADLGFLKMDSLKYTTLPAKYRSAYTAPEMVDDMASVNTTIDIYAAGLILYQAYNGGTLPFQGHAPAEVLPAPLYADYEMAEIIARACHPDPAERWQSPIDMGQAIVAYMQRNDVNDTPIVPPKMDIEDVVTESESSEEETVDGSDVADNAVIPDQVCIAECFTAEDDAELDQINALINTEGDDPGDLTFMNSMVDDDTAPGEHATAGINYMDLTGDVSSILEQADSLIAHDTPNGVVTPDPIDVPVPKPVLIKKKPEKDDDSIIQATRIAPIPQNLTHEEPEEAEEIYEYPESKTGNKLITILLVVVLLAGLAFGGYLFYTEFYLQNISDLRLEGSEDTLRVYVTSDVDTSNFIVICTDTHGTTKEAPVENGVAVFNDLNANTLYTVKVEVNGFGKLVGDITDNYTTPQQTSIASFQAVTGNEPGSVILSFVIDGQDADTWSITYQAQDEPLITETFTGHMLTVRGLTVGKTYNFTLSSESDVYLTGEDTLEYTAIAPVYAENVMISDYTSEGVTVSWKAPEGISVEQWTVRCYSESGFDESLVTSDCFATFNGISSGEAYTVEVIADGMSSGSRCYITANAVVVNDVTAATVGNNSLKLTWSVGEAEITGSWLVTYSIDGSEHTEVLRTSSPSVVISPIVPNATYSFTIGLESGNTVFGGTASCKTNEAATFSGYKVTSEDLLISLCKAPNAASWSYKDLDESDYTINLPSGQKAGLVLMLSEKFDSSDDTISVLYLIKDANGVPVSWNSTSQSWNSMWSNNYCELNIPSMPTDVGNYTLDLYFNGQSVFQQAFSING